LSFQQLNRLVPKQQFPSGLYPFAAGRERRIAAIALGIHIGFAGQGRILPPSLWPLDCRPMQRVYHCRLSIHIAPFEIRRLMRQITTPRCITEIHSPQRGRTVARRTATTNCETTIVSYALCVVKTLVLTLLILVALKASKDFCSRRSFVGHSYYVIAEHCFYNVAGIARIHRKSGVFERRTIRPLLEKVRSPRSPCFGQSETSLQLGRNPRHFEFFSNVLDCSQTPSAFSSAVLDHFYEYMAGRTIFRSIDFPFYRRW